jgi:uncharacterized protein YuzE
MKITYSRTADALYIKLNENQVDHSKSLGNDVVLDVDSAGIIVGIEVLGATRKDVDPYQIVSEYISEDVAKAPAG